MNREKLLSKVSKLDKRFKKFFKYSLDYLEQHNKSLKIKSGSTVRYKDDPAESSGWCDGSSIEIARDIKLFKETYVHEFCHMTQAVEDSYAWEFAQQSNFWSDLEKNRQDVEFWQEVQKQIKMEHDCERRVLEYNKEWKLFDTATYTRQANAYLYVYHYVFITKKWNKTDNIYNPHLLDKMPTELIPYDKLQYIDMDIMMMYSEVLK